MNINELSLAENKYILTPEVSGAELFKLTIFELILKQDLLVVKKQKGRKRFDINKFVSINREQSYFKSNEIYSPIYNFADGLKQIHLRRLLKNAYNYYDKDFNNYKKYNVISNLRVKHNFLYKNIFAHVFRYKKLTKKGNQYKEFIDKEIYKLEKFLFPKKNISNTEFKELFGVWGINLLLLKKVYIDKIGKALSSFKNDLNFKKDIEIYQSSFGDISYLFEDVFLEGMEYIAEYGFEFIIDGVASTLEGIEVGEIVGDTLGGIFSIVDA